MGGSCSQSSRNGSERWPTGDAQVEGKRTATALHCLELAGYTTYAPKIAVARRIALLFPNYVFIEIVSGWWHARWSAGVIKLLTNGGSEPARVPDRIIAELRGREGRDGLVQLPPAPQFKRGDTVRITGGVFVGQLGLFDGMRPHQRVAVLRLLGSLQRYQISQMGLRDRTLGDGNVIYP